MPSVFDQYFKVYWDVVRFATWQSTVFAFRLRLGSIMLTAYLDETGHSRDPNKKYVGLAGLVATEERWDVFEQEWREALEGFQIPNNYFHMADFAQSVGWYSRWKEDEPKRREVLNCLISKIRNTGLPFGAVVRLENYKATSTEFQAAMLDPYYVCLQHCVHGAAVQTLYEAPNERIRVVFADHPEYRGKIGPLYTVLRQSKQMAHHDLRLGDYSIEKPQDVLPLQAADIIAYEVGQYFEKFAHRSDKTPRWGFLEIMRMAFNSQTGMLFLVYFGRERLQQAQHEFEVVQAHNARAVERKDIIRAEIDAMIKKLADLRSENESR